MLPLLTDNPQLFPPLEHAQEGGLLAMGGDLRPERLLAAYAGGIFPWYGDNTPILWWSPDPRCVLVLDDMHVPRRLQRRRRLQEFTYTMNTAFTKVMQQCASVPRPHVNGENAGSEGPVGDEGNGGTWIVPEMIDAYTRLHNMGYAHSLEAWQGSRLVAGIYGVGIGRVFFGESMFTLVPDASKLALLELVDRLRKADVCLLDCQQYTAHMARFGAVEIPRKDFIALLRQLC